MTKCGCEYGERCTKVTRCYMDQAMTDKDEEIVRLRAFVRAWDEWRKNLRSKVWKEQYLTRVVDARDAIGDRACS